MSSKRETVNTKTARTSIGARRNPEAEAAILGAARQLLEAKGYAAFSIDEVARLAGAGKPTIYRRWPTRADLLIAVYSAEKSLAVRAPQSGSLNKDLSTYTRELWRFWRETPCGQTFRALIAEAQASEAALESLRNKFLPERTLQLREIFKEAVARGELSDDAVEVRLELYLGFNWLRLLTGRINDDESIDEMVRVLANSA